MRVLQISMLIAAALLSLARATRAEDRPVRGSRGNLTVAWGKGGALVSNGKAAHRVRSGDALPRVFQTTGHPTLRLEEPAP